MPSTDSPSDDVLTWEQILALPADERRIAFELIDQTQFAVPDPDAKPLGESQVTLHISADGHAWTKMIRIFNNGTMAAEITAVESGVTLRTRRPMFIFSQRLSAALDLFEQVLETGIVPPDDQLC